jgi:transglutaminase-like putative cysteine protease
MTERTPPVALDPGSRRWALGAAAACLLPLLLQLPTALALLVGGAALLVGFLSWRQPLHGLLRLVFALGLLAAVVLMSGFNFGRDTGCAVLAAMLAVKPAETFNLRDARSLIGFALFAPFATFLLDQGPLALGLGVAGAVLALCALQRLAELESGDAEIVGPRRRLAGVGRLLAIGFPLALAAFWLFPRLGSPLWGVPERSMARPGLSGEMSPGQWIDLIADDTPALRVRFFGATPSTSQMYWRGPVLWNFDGRTWSQSQWVSALPPAPVRHADVRWDYEVAVEPTDRRRFVVLDLPTSVPERTQLTHEHEILAPRPLTSLTRWRMQSAPPVAYEAELRPALRRMALALPEGFNPRTHALARQWRAAAGSDDAAIVRGALDWITREFGYTLTTPLPGRHGVDEFLFEQKAGFCEHYSSAFVVLMRAAGIPARVVTGYVGGYRNPVGDYWLVRRSDAHAWAEVWLEGRGWVRVDPTAAVAPERIYDTIDDRRPGAGADGLLGDLFDNTGGLFDYTDWLRRGWNDLVLGFDAERQQRMLRPLGIDRLDGVTLGLLFSLAALLALLWMAWLSGRGERQRDPVLRAWHALDRRYRRLGLGREPAESALDWAERVSQARPADADALRSLSQRFSDWRYAGAHPGTTKARRSLIRDLRAHRPH